MESKPDAVLITGCCGGIGAALVEKFQENGVVTIGIDRADKCVAPSHYIGIEFSGLIAEADSQKNLNQHLLDLFAEYNLRGLINNAAVQILGEFDDLTLNDFRLTMDVNVSAPFLLSKMCYGSLKKNKGSIINIGSIHSRLTKPEFIAYATSKAAIEGMTKAMAVDFGKDVKVNCISPAAVETEMLLDGFSGNPDGLERLKEYHPSGAIGKPVEIAELAYFLCSGDVPFINGSTIEIGGGIQARLHDPV